MAYRYATQLKTEHTARALGKEMHISPKMSVEICNHLRNRPLQSAKKLLLRVIAKQEAIPVRRHTFDQGHKRGVGPGRYPVKACEAILQLFESVEANAQFKGLNTSLLQIVHLCSHKASAPRHAGRIPGRVMKRAHVEVIVEEKAEKKEDKQ